MCNAERVDVLERRGNVARNVGGFALGESASALRKVVDRGE